MEYVRGASLGDVIAAAQRMPSGERDGSDFARVAALAGETTLPEPLPELFAGTCVMACCRIVARMARAAHHAHERGVVHPTSSPTTRW